MAASSSWNVGINPANLFQLQEQIGEGSFGKVYKGLNKKTNEPLAIKIIDLDNASDEIDDIQSEINILSQLDSPFITKYYGSYLQDSQLWICMEYCGGGSISDILDAGGPLDELYCAIVLKEVLRGLDYLHDQGKLHRDIKAANILLRLDGSVKLADFGITATMPDKMTFVGTPFWMSPEVIQQSGYNTPADIWSLGITAIELAKGLAPYSDLHPLRVLFLIPKNDPPTLVGNYSKYFVDFVSQCLQKDPYLRPTVKDLLKHKFIKNAKKPTFLTELIERKERHLLGKEKSIDHSLGYDNSILRSDNEEEPDEYSGAWDFGTVRSSLIKDRAPSSILAIPSDDSPHTSPNATMTRIPRAVPRKNAAEYYPFAARNAMKHVVEPALDEMICNARATADDGISSDGESLASLRRAFQDCERERPGIVNELLLQIVEKMNS